MDENEFKKHIRDLAHGHHHPEEHDWSPDGEIRQAGKPAKTNARKPAHKIVRKVKRHK